MPKSYRYLKEIASNESLVQLIEVTYDEEVQNKVKTWKTFDPSDLTAKDVDTLNETVQEINEARYKPTLIETNPGVLEDDKVKPLNRLLTIHYENLSDREIKKIIEKHLHVPLTKEKGSYKLGSDLEAMYWVRVSYNMIKISSFKIENIEEWNQNIENLVIALQDHIGGCTLSKEAVYHFSFLKKKVPNIEFFIN